MRSSSLGPKMIFLQYNLNYRINTERAQFINEYTSDSLGSKIFSEQWNGTEEYQNSVVEFRGLQ